MAGTGSCKWFSCVHSWWVDACKQIASSSSRLYIRFLGELVNGNMNELNNSHVNLEFSTSSSLKKLYHLQHEFPFGSVDFNFLSKCVFRTIKHLRASLHPLCVFKLQKLDASLLDCDFDVAEIPPTSSSVWNTHERKNWTKSSNPFG